jgi:sugar O-acyltransferase (sialic acid O-acetyltransferase NeuD family)
VEWKIFCPPIPEYFTLFHNPKTNSMKRLYIVGAGGFGRELEGWLERVPIEARGWKIAGYLDDDPKVLNGIPSGYGVVGSAFTHRFHDNDLVVLAIANPSLKERIYTSLKNAVEFMTFVSPDAIVGKYNSIGMGTVICPGCILTTNITLGECLTVNLGTQIGHDSKIGAYSSLMANVDIGGGCKIGERVYFGTNSTFVPRKFMTNDVKISAGTCVTRSVSRASTLYGNPCVNL